MIDFLLLTYLIQSILNFCSVVTVIANFTIQADVEEIKQKQAKVRAGQAKFEVHVNQQLEIVTDLLVQLLQETNVNNNGVYAADSLPPFYCQDIIIVGGWYGKGNEAALNSAEKYSMLVERSTLLPPMNEHRALAACCVYNNDVIIAGGHNGRGRTDSIEVLKIKSKRLQWKFSGCKLPMKLLGHVAVVDQDKLLVIGGCNEDKVSDAIHEVSLTPPYNSKLLCKMPKPRRLHRAELIDAELYILGGTTTGLVNDATDSALVYDLVKCEFKPCPPLPSPVLCMATVTWGNMIIVVGGMNQEYEALNDVIMFDTQTGKSQLLPSLIYKRSGCSAVIMNDVTVAIGGWNAEQGYLNSVESFTLGSEEWIELPEMRGKRNCPTAVVKPVS